MQKQVASACGFCFGVRRAIELAETTLASQQPLYALGPLVHNPQEMERLRQLGLQVVSDISQVPDRATLLIRAHGAAPAIYATAEARQLRVLDATCPHVAQLVKKAADFVELGYQLLILGDATHPEVQAALAWAKGEAIVITGPEDIASLNLSGKVAIVAQTTTKLDVWEAVLSELKALDIELAVGFTICHATRERQKAAQELAKQVDIMVVVGGHNSANTRNLVQLCSEIGTPTHHVETAAELDPAWFPAGTLVGITAGASTPDWIIKEVVTTVENMENKNNELTKEATQPETEEQVSEEKEETKAVEVEDKQAETESVQASEPAEEAEEEVAAPESEEDEPAEESSVMADVADQMADIRTGQIVEGTVVRVTDSEVFVDIRYKSDGVIQINELSNLPNVQPADVLQEGDTVKAVVLRLENREGNVVLSKRRADAEIGWKLAEEAYAKDEIVSGQVVEVVKGGLIVNLFNLRAFLPASLVDLRFVPDLNVYVDQQVDVKIIEMESNRRRLVVSRKAAIEEVEATRREATWANLEEGQIIEGVVQRLTDFGAFVDVGGVDGLVHVSEISWGRVNHPSEALHEGQTIKVKVLGVDRERERISLSLKQTLPDPWTLVSEQFKVGDVVDGKVMRTVSFGAFVELTPGVEGLVHISQLANERVERTEDVVNPGDEVKVRILSVNPAERRISLSMRDPSESRAERHRGGGDRFERRSRREGRSLSYREEGSVTLGDVFGDLFDTEPKEKDEDPEQEQ
ncbi:MAG: bifunctional 4-hydroxy-3-methylbut-2-enyl diphosphate reductase/30S ribosomal protein S1 [Firmicutes bacterium]|nr:bifunctional 4-hydroxy-3-methylbut-2-enyl diphosphate reductase/30S ribosomal protein S1 [Bacillota bacterium]